jgi:uncharacterized protein (TIGR02266 family)
VDDTGRRNDPRVKARLKVRFHDAKAFITEYTHNISKGGLFVRTHKPCESQSLVEVVLVLPETEQEITARGKVIHIMTPEKATEAHPAGMGLELQEITPADQKIIAAFIKDRLERDKVDRRQHPRYEAKIRVRFGSLEALIEEYSHNISHGGIFIKTNNPKKLGEHLRIILTHPQNGQELTLDGEVIRIVTQLQAQQIGHPPGMGVLFLNVNPDIKKQINTFIKGGTLVPES